MPHCAFTTHTQLQDGFSTAQKFALQLNRNTFGIMQTAQDIQFPSTVPGVFAHVVVQCGAAPQFVDRSKAPNLTVEAAMKNLQGGGVDFFKIDMDFTAIWVEGGELEKRLVGVVRVRCFLVFPY
jgi:hypothetical protein